MFVCTRVFKFNLLNLFILDLEQQVPYHQHIENYLYFYLLWSQGRIVHRKCLQTSSMYRLKSIGLRGHPCLRPRLLFIGSKYPSFNFILYERVHTDVLMSPKMFIPVDSVICLFNVDENCIKSLCVLFYDLFYDSLK